MRLERPYFVVRTSDGMVHITGLGMKNVGLCRTTLCDSHSWRPDDWSSDKERLRDDAEVSCLICLALDTGERSS